MKGIKTCGWKLILLYPFSISHGIYSLFIGVALVSWRGKNAKRSCALRTQSQGCHRTCCVIIYVFILGLHYWANWTKNKMKSTNFTRGETRGLIPTLWLLQVGWAMLKRITLLNKIKMLLLETFSLKTKFKKLTKRMTELDVALPKVNLDIDDHKKIFARMSWVVASLSWADGYHGDEVGLAVRLGECGCFPCLASEGVDTLPVGSTYHTYRL